MITVTRLNHEPIVVNADLIEYVETTPDTVISLSTGEKFMVLETPDQVVDLVVAYERRIHHEPHFMKSSALHAMSTALKELPVSE